MNYNFLILPAILFLFPFNAMIYSQNIKNENDMGQKFKKIALNQEDFGETLEKIDAHCNSPNWPTYEFLGKPDISTKDDKIVYTQEIFLKDGTKIFADYMILDSPEDAMKAINCLTSETTWIAHVLYVHTKEELGLEKYDAAFYYDESIIYALKMQHKNILIHVSVHTENERKGKTMQMCQQLAKTIIKRINTVEIE